jgi:peptidoglycan/xylan/chitin deacetylase (PgdA/CDA1 family)
MAPLAPTRRALTGGLLLSPLALSARAAPRPWPLGARAAVSLSYDDGLDSQLEQVVPALEARGLKGTFFLVQENVDERIDDWIKVGGLGHEIGNHTVSHPCVLGGYTEAAFAEREILPMEAYLDHHFGPRPVRTFAYPCGFLGLGRGDMRRRLGRYRQALEQTFAAARTVAGAPNDPARVATDRLDLQAFEPTYDVDGVEPAIRYLDAALARGAWAILVFHEVLPARMGEGDTSIRTHERILDLIAQRPLWCAPMGEVFTHLCGSKAA